MEQNIESESSPIALGLMARLFLSGVLVVYLFLVVLGPLSNPIASANLTGPMGIWFRPIHQALFIGHGYRFFGPDPGPSHIVEYRIQKADGEVIEGHFPDRDVYWPRLRYHRWFMLSESIYQAAVSVPEESVQRQLINELEKEIGQRRLDGELPSVRTLVLQRDRLEQEYNFNRQRTESLIKQVARFLLDQYGGTQIELRLRERLIASPNDIASRVKLTDDRFLSEPRPIGKFNADELWQTEAVE